MRRLAAARRFLAMLACLAVSTDTATKVLHGVVHEHEAGIHHQHATQHAATVVHVAEAAEVAIGAPDDDVDHRALHAAAAANIVSKAPPALTVSAQPTLPEQIAEVTVPRSWGVSHASPWVRARPDQPRAPPVG